MSRRRLFASGLGAALLLCSGSVFAQAAAEPAASEAAAAEATITEPAAEASEAAATEPAAEAAADDTAAPTAGDEAAQMAPAPAPPERVKSKSLEELLATIIAGRSEDRELNRRREEIFQSEKNEQQRLLNEALRTLARLEQRSVELETRFQDNEVKLAEVSERLRNRLGSLGELFGVVRLVAGDTRGLLESSMTTAQFPGREETLGVLSESDELPSVEQLRELWYILQHEMTQSGRVARFKTLVVTTGGDRVEREVVRAGVFNAVSDGKFLAWTDGSLQELPSQPAGRHTRAAAGFEAATEGTVTMAIDPSRGQILGLLVQAPGFQERINQGGYVGYVIIGLGFWGLTLLVIRAFSLLRIGQKMNAQLKEKTANRDNPLGRAMAVYEENKDAGVETLELKLDECILKDVPLLERGLTTLKVLSVIAPLLGLLGTVTGMIETFQQIVLFGTGDPKTMAGGISEALVTTMLGLVVAAPLVLLHSLLRDRSKSLTQVLEEQTTGMIAERAEAEGRDAA